ncbi:Crp/Fnr family transcriptional regulator [Pullulanibacillus sp. KACC 23026]|uniref:Crp/Fnr family transcriptional regulator n=1 Tax=Pullulanibacillus sp. KACC 23026 TaxID=3028315 RepID=UPI0023AF757D|nr:Crp/Fnr family transcriptional regulator [Pullulanibacillus sp. KACC 23026]WEG13806.1 Crp/Fnr family transcriptional regulator [Pullulanibacillus sp. KACC 23026]
MTTGTTSSLNVECNTEDFREFELLSKLMKPKTYIKNSTIYCEGDPLTHLYYVQEGSVKLSKVSDDGKDLIMHYFFPGDLFGEYRTFGEQKATFSAEAVETCKIGVISLEQINDVISQHGSLGISFSEWLSKMQWYTQLKLRDILFHGKNGALASTLIRAANTFGLQEGDKIVIAHKLTNYDLANLIGATRETVNRLMSQFQKEQLIEVHHSRIVITNLNELKKVCHCEHCPVAICRL